ncbi:MAG: ABC transporter ATP-binding protein [Firmicutes bacterium CAG:176_63_11]|nr:MAG: ABC transporter ATP-binding protein [Firmicutes bacterium CAG:176_63_11]
MLRMRNITKTFNSGTVDERVALDHMDLTLQDGDFVTVIGGNGAGKSTMQNAICGTWQPDEGSIELDGVNVSGMPEYKRARYLGRVYQDPMMGTSAGMEIEENLALAVRRGKRHTLRLGIRRSEREDYRRRLKELGLGLEDRLTTKVGTLSGGQRQALTLLMATLQRPKLLLLDEHTAALDPQTAARVMDLITHNMRDAIRYGNRLLMLHNGRIVLDISGEEKARLTVADLMDMFRKVSGREYDNDRTLLA